MKSEKQQQNEKRETATSFKLHPIAMTHKKVPHAM
jgi:hypothetical protein